MLYDYQGAINAGANPQDVINYLASSTKYDAQGAINAGAKPEDVMKYMASIPTSTAGGVQADTTNGVSFPASPSDSPIEAGLKSLGNVPSSAINLAKGIGNAVLHPIDTIGGVLKTVGGGISEGLGALGLPVDKTSQDIVQSRQRFDAFTSALKDRYGSLENLQKTATNDPVGFGADVMSIISGGASALGKGAEVANTIEKVGKAVTEPVARATEGIAGGVSKMTKFGVSQATGLNPDTITQIVKDPQAFSDANPISRSEVANTLKTAVDSRLSDLNGLGKEYQVLRDSNQVVTIPENTIPDVLSKYGVKLDQNGQIVTSAESRPLSPGDKTALQNFLDNYGKERVLSSNGFLNTREALSNLSKYDASKTNISTSIARDLRASYDTLGKQQINGLNALDTQYAPERQLLGQIKKDIFTPQGELKDNAISKIANLTGPGKENVLARMEQIIPDIGQRIKILKATEDIEKASGIKVGTYAKAGALIGGISTGNIPLIIGSIIAQPEIAVPLLKGYGIVGSKVSPFVNALKTIANDVNNFKLPSSVLEFGKKN